MDDPLSVMIHGETMPWISVGAVPASSFSDALPSVLPLTGWISAVAAPERTKPLVSVTVSPLVPGFSASEAVDAATNEPNVTAPAAVVLELVTVRARCVSLIVPDQLVVLPSVSNVLALAR